MQSLIGKVVYLDYNTKGLGRRQNDRYEFSDPKQRVKMTVVDKDGKEHHLLTNFYIPTKYHDEIQLEYTPSIVPSITGEIVKGTYLIFPDDLSSREKLDNELFHHIKYGVYENGPDSNTVALQYKSVFFSTLEKKFLAIKGSPLGQIIKTQYDLVCQWSEWYVRGKIGLKEAIPAIFTKEKEALFYQKWYDKHTSRRLRIFGIAEKDLERHWFGECRLYYEIMKNPYAVPILSFEQRESVFRHYPHLRSCDSDAGESIQGLFSDIKLGHTATPVDKLQNVDIESLRSYDVTLEHGCCYLDYPREAELGVVEHIKKILSHPSRETSLLEIDNLDADQENAVSAALSHPLVLVTGGAGRGKSSVLLHLVNELTSRKGIEDWIVAFPTGKSMMVILDKLPNNVDSRRFGTFSRWISVQKNLHRDRENHRVVKHLIVDEASMVSARLLHEMLKHYPNIEKMTLIGDDNQLQPVEWGRPFKQLVSLSGIQESNIVRCHLNTNHRCQGKGIVSNADSVASIPGPFGGGFTELKPGGGFEIDVGDKKDVVEKYFSLLDSHGVLGLQVISPMNKDVSGKVDTDLHKAHEKHCGLNDLIRERIQEEPHPRTKYNKKTWMIGDKVMINTNVYAPGQEVFNGQMGIVVGLIKEGSIIKTFVPPKDVPLNSKGKFVHERRDFMCLTKRGWTDIVNDEDIYLALDYKSPSVEPSAKNISGLYVAIPGPTLPDGTKIWKHREFYADTLATVRPKRDNVYWSIELGEYPDDEEYTPSESEDSEDAVVELERISVLSMNLLDHAYAITVHKSQGSEWDAVITYIKPCGKNGFIGKNIVYTALTRAKYTSILITPNKHYVDEKCRDIPEHKCENLPQLLS